MGGSGTAVITGVGLIGPCGVGLDPLWDALVARRSAIGRLTRWEDIDLPCRIAGEIVDDTQWDSLVTARQRRTWPRATQMSVAAATLACRDAALDLVALDAIRFGVSVGTAVGGWEDAEAQSMAVVAHGARRVNPFIATAAPPFSCTAAVATVLGAQGPSTTFTTGCAAAVQAIGHAAALIALGEVDVCIAGGVECPLSPVVLAGMGRTGELVGEERSPAHASRPFDRGHAGMVLSEGAAMFVIERAEHAAARGASVRAIVAGTAESCDARGLYRVDEEGAIAGRTLRRLLDRVDAPGAAIDWVCSHANSAPVFDRKEAGVLHAALGGAVEVVPVSSIKGVTGHPLGAAGAFQSAAVVAAMQRHGIPPTTNLEDPDPDCPLRHVRGAPIERAVRTAVVTSYGYGGVNAFLVLRSGG